MRQVLLWLLAIVAPWTIGSGTSAETLDSVDQISLEVESTFDFNVPISALLLGGDTVLCGSGAGIFIEAGADRPWQKLIGCVLRSTDWWADCYRREEFQSLYSPKCLGKMPGTNKVIVFEEHCNFLLMLPFDSDTSSVAVLWRSDRDGDYLEEVTLQNSVLLCGVYSLDNHRIVIQKPQDSRYYRRVFTPPPTILTRLDTILIGSTTLRPAMNPRDSTIWIDIYGYDSICVVDFDGDVVGMIPISGTDWIPPPRPKSRIHSPAVYVDWVSRWTPTTGFQYASPGYFIRQHRIGWQSVLNDSIPLYSTLVWRADRQPVELSVDHRWQLAGVQPDGRIIFGHYDVADDSCRIVLNVTRIEP